MRYLGGGISHHIWHLLPQPNPISHRRSGPSASSANTRPNDDHDDSDSENQETESDSEQMDDCVAEDLQEYLKELEDDHEATTMMVEHTAEYDECKEWGYGDSDAIQEISKLLDEEDEHDDNVGPEGSAQVDDDAFDLRGFAEL